jgi:two-component system nitrogen regulation sensor histidine kinase NtrY
MVAAQAGGSAEMNPTPQLRAASRRRRSLWLTVLGLGVTLLAAAVFTLGSLNTPIAPRTRSELVILFALSTFLIAAFLVFLVIFGRALLRGWAERRAGVPGSRFKWKMVMGALGISLLPVIFMFFISYGLWNRSLNKWFPLPLEVATEHSRQLLRELETNVPPEQSESFARRRAEIERQLAIYEAQKQGLRDYKTTMLLALGLFTVVLLFSVTWFALFLSKMVTQPIEALAQATGEIARGNFAHRLDVLAHDELATLVASFNEMTAQLGESRRKIEEFTRELKQAVEQSERRRQLLATVLENIPTGVLSLDGDGRIVRSNPAVVRMFGPAARDRKRMEELLGEETARGVQQLMRKSLRMGTASKEFEVTLEGRVLHAAVTVSALGSRRDNPGFVVVVDDLSELLRAQKAAAWQEVAQRIAHEIRNPLTPIQLSAQRLARHLERGGPATAGDADFARLAAECASLIEREATALKSLVDEFSQFARFPAPNPVTTDVNAVVRGALDVFRDRVEGVSLRTELARDLPPLKADPELLRRAVVNLVDNALEAMESVAHKELTVATRLDAESETFEIVVADTGHGIPPADKDKLFLPHFSTRSRGTGLGLAIASRIVAEHHGTIRADDNPPRGARFIIRLPVAETPVAAEAPAGTKLAT